MKIEKKIERGSSGASQPVKKGQEPLKGKPRTDEESDFVIQDEKKSPIPYIIGGIVVIALAAAYFLFMA